MCCISNFVPIPKGNYNITISFTILYTQTNLKSTIMKTNIYTNYDQNENFSNENAENIVEQSETVTSGYKSTRDQLLCWGED
jgi:hypothetical protein